MNMLEAEPPTASHRTMAMMAHLSSLVGLLGIPSFLGPLIVFVVWKDEHPFVRRQAAEALNFQLLVLIVMVVTAVAAFLLTLVVIGLLLWPLLFILPFVALVLTVIAAVEANRGNDYRYPLNWRLVA